ncbi:hypothetical protein EK21DRAFT_76950 [Setomelanomma holmii]|uniref:U6 snRNA phosphodiesterase n=1 Tax=Setomelanomma holmii TaxID=210430 RepID=A0A9P4LI42_9PLEO|nr:hypothetical protein EK21DRAFT_76950 [Setomelanomma holmii]
MPLVQYPNSESDEADSWEAKPAQPCPTTSKVALKRKRVEATQELPPLPSAFFDCYATNARVSTSDNPSLHGGRKRAIPHVEGNWPSHVYLEWIPSQTESDGLHNLIQTVRATIAQDIKAHPSKLAVLEIKTSLQSELGAPLPLHVSLSRTLQIRTEDREVFLNTLNSTLRKAAVESFRFTFAGLKWVPNFERNRWFLVLGIEKPQLNELNRLLDACNEAAKKCGHPSLYIGGHGDGPMETNTEEEATKRRKTEDVGDTAVDRSDRFHISIAWNLEEPDPEWLSMVKGIDVNKYIQPPRNDFSAVKARIGNTVHSIALKPGKPQLLASGSWS